LNWIKIILCLATICASAYATFTIPITESGIPFTLQSLAVFVVAGFMTSDEAKVCLLTYFFLGIIGLPIFADGSAGLDKVMGPSGGFLYGFGFAGWFIASIIPDFKPMNWGSLFLIFFIATLILFGFGLGHLAFKFDLDKALEYGFHPFWKMALVKALFATLIVGFLRRDVILRKTY